MNNEVGVYARKSRRHRSEFLAFAFLFLSRLFQRRREGGGSERVGKDVFRLATKGRKKKKKKKKEKKKKEKKKNHVKYATIFLRRSNFETLKGNRLELMAFQ